MKKGINILLLGVTMVMVMAAVMLNVKIDSMRPTPEADVVTETDTRQEQETFVFPCSYEEVSNIEEIESTN